MRSMTKNAGDYDEKYVKIKFDLDNDLTLNKTIQIHSITIVVRAIFMKIKNIIHKFPQANVYMNY